MQTKIKTKTTYLQRTVPQISCIGDWNLNPPSIFKQKQSPKGLS